MPLIKGIISAEDSISVFVIFFTYCLCSVGEQLVKDGGIEATSYLLNAF